VNRSGDGFCLGYVEGDDSEAGLDWIVCESKCERVQVGAGASVSVSEQLGKEQVKPARKQDTCLS
jgi:hypothetical protein